MAEARSLASTLENLAGNVALAGRRLDEWNAEEVRRHEAKMRESGLPAGHPLTEHLRPVLYGLSECEIDLAVLTETRREVGVAAQVSLSGRTVHSFLELRYGLSEARRDHIRVTVESIPSKARVRKETCDV